jgi:hypothetical protein
MAARAKPFEDALAISNELREHSKLRLAPEPGKGRPPLRKCPDDFDVVFVEIGRVDCETFYRAARVTIDRWLLERGKERLIKERAQYVEHQRRKAKEQPRPDRHSYAPKRRDRRRVSLCVARHAAHFLRMHRNGGWRVSMIEPGQWFVGLMRMSAGDMLDMAIAKGFDPKEAKLICSIEEQQPNGTRH